MEWLFDPEAWISLVALTVIEVILAIDNLVFIAILANRLPAHQQNKARVTGLVAAMLIMLAMLCLLSWLRSLTEPLFTLFSHGFSGKDLLLFFGGFFLLYKTTTELHERLDGTVRKEIQQKEASAGFGIVVTQIIVLDVIFSMDAVVTAVGFADYLAVMLLSVIFSAMLMISMQKPITTFVNTHKSVVILCLAFLLMVGLSLVAESLGFEIPEGYIYAAIGFSALTEAFNQIGWYKAKKNMAKVPMRERTANLVLSLLGGKKEATPGLPPETQSAIEEAHLFGEKERDMVSGVLTLGERNIRSIMTPRNDIAWVDMTDDPLTIQEQIRKVPHSFYPVCEAKLDNVRGIARAQDILNDLHQHGKIQRETLHDAIVVPESVGVLWIMEMFKKERGQIGFVVDEYGSIEGLVTPIDILEAIAGEFPDKNEAFEVKEIEDGVWEIDGATDLYSVEHTLETDGLVDDDQEFSTLNGLIMEHLGTVPVVGQTLEHGGFRFEVVSMDGQRIETVKITRIETPDA
ncbi:MAG: TerC family protein [Oxalobacter sp.]|nr:TerC family protein [Oxalobacter sp.]